MNYINAVRAIIQLAGKTATGFHVPEEVVAKLGSSKKPPVKITIGDYTCFFDGLSYSNRGRFVLSIEGAKTPETRQRRIDKAVSSLKEGRIQ